MQQTRNEFTLHPLPQTQLNRRSRGRLLQAYGGNLAALFLDLAAALRKTRCFRVRVDPVDKTADLVSGIVEAGIESGPDDD